MHIGSIVETMCDFNEVRRIWKLPYPKKGDVLTVSAIEYHSDPKKRNTHGLFLRFEELPFMPQLAYQKAGGEYNFLELQLPDEIYELLKIKECPGRLCKIQYL